VWAHWAATIASHLLHELISFLMSKSCGILFHWFIGVSALEFVVRLGDDRHIYLVHAKDARLAIGLEIIMDKEAYEYYVDPRTAYIQKPHGICHYAGIYGRNNDDVEHVSI